jgi:hypothetical protein
VTARRFEWPADGKAGWEIAPPLPILASGLTGAADASHHGSCVAGIDGKGFSR